MKYKYFKEFIFRTPLYPYNKIEKFSYEDPVFREGLRISSPILYQISKQKMLSRQIESLHKYKLRSHFRATPFGYFGGVGCGIISKKSKIELENKHLRTVTRLDVSFINKIFKYFETDLTIQPFLKLHLNTSLYRIKNSLRYIEYKEIKGKREYFTSEIEISETINFIIETVNNGIVFSDLVELISKKFEDATKEQIIHFLQELIDCQFLKTNLEPRTTGKNLLHECLNFFSENKIRSNKAEILKKIDHFLKLIDSTTLGNREKIYNDLESFIKKLNFKDLKLQTDLFIQSKNANISYEIVNQIEEAIKILNILSRKPKNIALDEFKKKFFERYENQKIPLELVIDPDIGLGISSFNHLSTDSSELLSGLFNYKSTQKSKNSIRIDSIDKFLIDKYYKAIKDKKDIISIKLDDLSFSKENYDDLPYTFNALIEIINASEKQGSSIILNSVQGSSAANLISRFSHLDKEIEDLVIKIIQKEEQLGSSNDEILAEVVHVPEDNLGNITFRKVERKYEIPYLARSNNENDNQIRLNDILVQVIEGKKIVLWSKKHNKKIKPIHSSAFNYDTSSIPIFVFLSLLQLQDIRNSLYFNWGEYFENFEFLPRVMFKNVILSLKTWNLKSENFFSNETLSREKVDK